MSVSCDATQFSRYNERLPPIILFGDHFNAASNDQYKHLWGRSKVVDIDKLSKLVAHSGEKIVDPMDLADVAFDDMDPL